MLWVKDVISVDALTSVALGYLLGSVLPGYLIVQWLKGVDIRQVGSRHAGTTNVMRCAGLWPAAVTAVYDTIKGVLAIQVSLHFLGVSQWVAFLSGICSVAGHIFPFYLGFRGGRGAATATGILLFGLYELFPSCASYTLLAHDVGVILFVIFSILFITRNDDLLAMTVLPLLMYFLVLRFPPAPELALVMAIVAFLFVLSLSGVIVKRPLKIDVSAHPDFRLWRVVIRPVAMAFPFLSFWLSKTSLITLVGSVLALFLAVDIARLSHSGLNRLLVRDIGRALRVFKEKERSRLSSMALFLMGCLLSFSLFERTVAVATVTFLIFGDVAAKILGLAYGRRPLFHKTVEGTLAHLMACTVAAYLLYLHLGLSLPVALAGGVAASLAEALPFGVDDNLTVPVISGFVMVILPLLA